MTPSDAREQMVRLRFELAVGSWSPSHAECDAAVEALKALRLPDTTVAEALVSGTWAASSTAPWELPVEEGGSRLTRLMHDVAELLMSTEGGDAEDREVTRQNIVELLAASSEHRPTAPSLLSRLFGRARVAAWLVAGKERLRVTTRGGRRRAAGVRGAEYRQYAAAVTEIAQSVLKHWEQGTRLEGDEYKALHAKLYAATDALAADMNPYIIASTNKMIPAIQQLLSSVAREARPTAQERDALVDAFEERLREFDRHALAAVRDIMGAQTDLHREAAA